MERHGRALLKRDGDRVWLDLDVFYPPPKQHPNTVFKSLAIVFQACGANTSYVDLLGVSAAAFRLQVGGNLCPSSPHPHLGFSCDGLAEEALGYEYIDYPWDSGYPRTVERAKQAVVESVDSGKPVLTADEETGLAVGYVEGGKDLLIRDPYSNRGDPPEVLKPDWPGWGMTTIAGLPHDLTREPVITSLRTAVRLASTTEVLGNSYASGFSAFEGWQTALRDPAYVESAEIDAGAIVLGNAHIYYCLVDARRCAAEYLRETATRFVPEASDTLNRAADLYQKVAETLDTGWDNVPWPWQLKSPSEWTMDRRRQQADLLSVALEFERGAVQEMEAALATLA